MIDMREIGPSYYFAPPRVFENLLTQVMIRMEDAGRDQTAHVPFLHGRGQALWRGDPRRQAGVRTGPAALCAGQPAGLRPAAQRAGHEPHPRRLYGGCRHRPRPVPLLPLDRHQPQAVLWPDRNLRLRLPAAGSPDQVRLRRQAGAGVEVKIADNGEILVQRPDAAQGVLQAPRCHGRVDRRRRLFPYRRRRLPRRGRPPQDHRPRQGCRQARRTARCSRPTIIENKLKFFQYIKEAVASATIATWSVPSSTSTWARSATGPNGVASPMPATPTWPPSPRFID